MKGELTIAIGYGLIYFKYTESSTILDIKNFVIEKLNEHPEYLDQDNQYEKVCEPSEISLTIGGKKYFQDNDSSTFESLGLNIEHYHSTIFVKLRPKIICEKVIVDGIYEFDTNEYPTIISIIKHMKNIFAQQSNDKLIIKLYNGDKSIDNFTNIRSTAFNTKTLDLTCKKELYNEVFKETINSKNFL